MTYLVTGATGTVGRAIVARLLADGEPVRALTRDPDRAGLPSGAEVVAGNLSDPDTLDGVFDGVRAMYLFPVFSREAETLARAADAGVRRVVVLSTDAVSEGVDMGGHVAVETAATESGLEWTIVRPGEFAGNKPHLWARSIRDEGVVRTAYPDVTGRPVHEADIADVVVTALREPGHHTRVYRPVGPLATHREQIAALGQALGREIAVETVSHSVERRAMIEVGTPPWAADHILSYFPRWIDEPPEPSTDIETVTGHPPRTFAQWAVDHADELR